MIIKISQTASNTKQTYLIEGENFFFEGKNGSLSNLQDVVISNESTTIRGDFILSKGHHYLPFRYLFGKETKKRNFRLYRNDTAYASIAFSEVGFLKSRYELALDNGDLLYAYTYTKKDFDYVSIYLGDRQIALLETYLTVRNGNHIHKLYLLDDATHYAELLSFFVLYYANYHFNQRFHMSWGYSTTYAWTYSRYNKKYDPTFRETHFPNEDFFGKIHLFS